MRISDWSSDVCSSDLRAQKIIDTPEVEDVSIFPMAMPMIAGPGSIASVMLTMARSEGSTETLIVLAAMGSVLVLMLAALLAAGPMMRILGQKIEAVFTRLLGVDRKSTRLNSSH